MFRLVSLFLIVFGFQIACLVASPKMTSVIGKPFLAQQGESLAGASLFFPADFKSYKLTFIAYGFSRKSGDDFDSWLKPFQDRYKDDSNVFFVSIPMIGKLPKWILKQMKKGMEKKQKDKWILLCCRWVHQY